MAALVVLDDGRDVEVGILPEDSLLECAQLRRGLESDLVERLAVRTAKPENPVPAPSRGITQS